MNLSVIIPTYNRYMILKKTLESLCCKDQHANVFEISVVDDGSTDATALAVSAIAANSSIKLNYFYQDNKGAAAARNRGMLRARGDIILFIDDDIIASPSLLAEHMRYHHLYPSDNVAILGQVMLAPTIPETPINLQHTIHMWRSLRDGQEVNWQYFITCNISLKRRFLLKDHNLFDEQFSGSGFEDTELGYKLSKKGLRILYNEHALGHHNHDVTLPAMITRKQHYGRTLAFLHRKYPEWKSELNGYHVPVSLSNSPRQLISDILRRTLQNELSVSVLVPLAHLVGRIIDSPPAFLVRQIGNYYFRKGYRHGERELERGI